LLRHWNIPQGLNFTMMPCADMDWIVFLPFAAWNPRRSRQ